MVPSDTVYTIAVGFYTSLALISATVAIAIWKKSGEKINSTDIADIVDKKIKEFDEETAKFVKPILMNLATLTDGGIDRQTIREELETSVQETEITVDDVKRLLEACQAVKKPKNLHKERREAYKWSYGSFALVSLASIGSAFTVVVMSSIGLEFSLWPPDGWDIPLITIALLMAVLLFVGISKFKKANYITHELEGMKIDNN